MRDARIRKCGERVFGPLHRQVAPTQIEPGDGVGRAKRDCPQGKVQHLGRTCRHAERVGTACEHGRVVRVKFKRTLGAGLRLDCQARFAPSRYFEHGRQGIGKRGMGMAIVRIDFDGASADDLPPAYFEMVVAEALRLPAQVWKNALGAFLKDIVPIRPSAISAPAHLIWGDCDPFVPRADQDRLLEALPLSTLQVFGGLGHAPHWDRPDFVARTIVHFLARQTQSA